MPITGLDHLVITVHDLAASLAFYTRVLGMEAVTYGDNRHALRFGTQKINLHEAGAELEPRALRPLCGSADLCLVTSDPLDTLRHHVQSCGVEIVLGPVTREGARGEMTSIYFRDPDGNLIEVASYAR